MRIWKALLFAVVACVVGTLPATHAVAATVHRAGVIVDNGDRVTTAIVEFSEDSISGLELLQRAGFAPETYGFSGLGAAVCRMAGKGCEVGQSCLTCDGGNYWSYSRAASGSDALTSSRVGASTTRVSDGDIEGWKYGTGGVPAFQDLLGTVTAPPPPTTSTTVVAGVVAPVVTAPPSSTLPTPVTPSTSVPPTASTSTKVPAAASSVVAASSSVAGTAPVVGADSTTTSRASSATSRDRAATRTVAARATNKGSDSGSGVVGMVFVVVALGAVGLWVERRRRVVRAAEAP